MSSSAEVTVLCTTYNQSAYLERCLEGIVSQKTTFKYKVLIHDDCSTDGTTDIVRSYAKEYPDLITPIVQERNLYSRGIDRDQYIIPLIEGPYVAVCEGDDYWCDDLKLQRQYDYMEKHPEASLCVHAVKVYDESLGLFEGFVAPSETERDFCAEDIIASSGDVFGTNSVFFRTEYYSRPEAYMNWSVADWPRNIYLSTVGKVHYLPTVMSVYRRNVPGSWSGQQKKREARKKTVESLLDGLARADAYTDYAYKTSFEIARFLVLKQFYIEERDWSALNEGDMGKWFRSCSSMERGIAWLKCHIPVFALSHLVLLGRRMKSWKRTVL